MFEIYDKRSWSGLGIIYRTIGNYIALKLSHTSIMANSVTLIGLLFGILAGILLSLGNYRFGIVALIFLQLAMVLDYTDGTLARLKNEVTPFGQSLDSISGHTIFVVINIAIAIMFRFDTIIMFGVLVIVSSRHLTYVIDRYFHKTTSILKSGQNNYKIILDLFFPTHIVSYYLLFSFSYLLEIVRIFIVYSAVLFVIRLLHRTNKARNKGLILENIPT